MINFNKLFNELALELEAENLEREHLGGILINPSTITLFGQMALFADSKIEKALNLYATNDFDAVVAGDLTVRAKFKAKLKLLGFNLDDLSEEIWMPKETKYKNIFSTKILEVKAAEPIYVIASKAIKAPDKNKILIINALIYFGDELMKLLDKYGFNKEVLL